MDKLKSRYKINVTKKNGTNKKTYPCYRTEGEEFSFKLLSFICVQHILKNNIFLNNITCKTSFAVYDGDIAPILSTSFEVNVRLALFPIHTIKTRFLKQV